MNDAIKMQLSAFVDGELSDNETDLLVRRLSQDRELRQQIAEYLAMGRVMRGESQVAGSELLRQRIIAELGDGPSKEPELPAPVNPRSRFWRPVGGFAVAATVALVAIVGLRQTTTDSDDLAPVEAGIVATSEDAGYTVPNGPDDLLRQYYLSHGETSSDLGANGINARLVSVQLREDVIVDQEAVDQEAEDDSDAAENQSATQP